MKNEKMKKKKEKKMSVSVRVSVFDCAVDEWREVELLLLLLLLLLFILFILFILLLLLFLFVCNVIDHRGSVYSVSIREERSEIMSRERIRRIIIEGVEWRENVL